MFSLFGAFVAAIRLKPSTWRVATARLAAVSALLKSCGIPRSHAVRGFIQETLYFLSVNDPECCIMASV